MPVWFLCTLSVLWGSKTALHPNHAKFLQTRLNFQFELAERKSVEQDPVSTMHKTGWTNYSSMMVDSMMWLNSTLEVAVMMVGVLLWKSNTQVTNLL